MSTESEQPTASDVTSTNGDNIPDEPPPVPPQPEPEEEPPPPPPEQPTEPIVFEPATWYEVTSVCVTETCPNLNTTTTEPLVYSNAGTVTMICGVCGQRRPILAATKLDPQPEMS